MRRTISVIASLGAGALLIATTGCRDQQQQQQPGQEQQQREQQEGTGGAGQQDEMRQDEERQQQQQQTQTMTGRVTSVQGDTLRVLDERRNQVVELKVPDDAQVTRQGQRISVDEISEGAEVRASYKMQEDELVAESLQVTSEPREQQQEQQEQ